MNCKICSGNFSESPDSLILCSHKDGFVHFGCCIDNCSHNKAPCEHSRGFYEKVST